MNSFKPNFNKVAVVSVLAVVGLLASVLAPVTSLMATQNSQLRLDTIAKNVSTGTAYGDTTNADLGQTIRVRLNLENLTSADLNDITVKAQLPSTASGSINVIGTAQSSAVGFLSDPTSVNLNSGTGYLTYVPNSTKVETIGGPVTSQPDTNGSGPLFSAQGLRVTLSPGASAQQFVYFDATVTNTAPVRPALNIEFYKTVKNVTQNGTFGSSVTAKAGDTLEFNLFVHNGCTNGTCGDYSATNVVLKDVLSISGTSGTNSATFTSNEAGPFTRTVSLTLANGSTVSYLPGSTRMINPNDNTSQTISDVNGISALLTAAGYKLDIGQGEGVLPFCNQYRRNIVFQVKVSAPVGATQGQVLGVSKLPSTGPETAPILALISMIPTGIMLRRFKV